MIQQWKDLEAYLEADKEEILQDYEPTLIPVEDFQLEYEENSYEKVQDVNDIPFEGHNLMEVVSLLACQQDELMDFGTQV